MANPKIIIQTPQFLRSPNEPAPHPAPEPFEHVLDLDYCELRSLGCKAWDEPDADGRVLLLFPGEWYRAIPEGFKVTIIGDPHGPEEAFVPGVTDDDIRFGCLPYGVLVKR
jgi:hypothetical protein